MTANNLILIMIALLFIYNMTDTYFMYLSEVNKTPQLITVKCSLDIPTTDDIPALKIGEITE